MASSSALSYMRRKTARYVKNVGRSVGYVAIEEMKPHSTAITQLYKDSKELSNNLKRSANERRIRKLKSKAATTTLSASANKQKKQGSTITKNLLSDLRSGKLYNKDRMDRASLDMFDMGADADNYTGVSFDFGDDDFGDSLYGDGQGEYGESTPSGRRGGSTVAKAFNQASMSASMVSAEANIRSAEYIANSNNLAARAIYDSMNYNFGQVMLGLASIDTNIQVVQATVGDTLNTHALNSAKFYIDSTKYQQESLELLKKISSGIDAINANTSPAPPGGTRRGAKEYTMSGILGGGRGGLPDFKALAANAKKGFKEEYLPNLLLMLGLGGDMGGSGGGLTSNPIGVITTELMRMFGIDLVPRKLKKGVANVNNTVQNLFAQGLMKARGANFKKILNQDNPILAFLSDQLNDLKNAILPKSNYTKIDTGNYNKRKVDWDGIARKSLVEVIPTQLGKILSALTGENEMRYDFEHGKWVDTHQQLKEFNENRRKEKMLMGGDFMAMANSLIEKNRQYEDIIDPKTGQRTGKKRRLVYDKNGNRLMNNREIDRMKKMLEDFNQGVYKSTGTSSEMEYLLLIDPKKRIDSNLLSIASKYGIRNKTELENLRKLAKAMRTTSVGRNAIDSYGQNMAIGKDTVGMNNRYKESLNDSMINMMVDGSYNFGNAAVAKTKQSGLGSRANWNKNKHENGLQSIMYATDDYNHDMFFYLQGIFQYTKHVSDNLPLLISGTVKDGKKGKIKGVKIPSSYKGIDAIPEETIEYESEEVDTMGHRGANKHFGASEDMINSTAAEFDGIMSEDMKAHVRTRQYAMQNGMHQYLMDTNEDYKKAEEDFQKYVGKFGNPNTGGKVRGLLNKTRIGSKLTSGYDKFTNILEAIGGSKEDFEAAIGHMIPGLDKVKKLRKDIAESKASKAILSADAREAIAGGYNGQAAKGRKVTKTGIVAVSEGELIIPSEMNPFYHGVTNKAKQIKDEQKAVQQYFGNYAEGGTTGPRLSLSQMVQYVMSQNPGMTEKEATKQAKKLIRNFYNVRNNGKNVTRGLGDTVQTAINTVNDGMVNIFGPRDKDAADEEKKKLGGLIDGIMKDAGMAKSSIITGSVLGGGISLLTGAVIGPVAGAAIGAATGLIAKSDKVQKALFGEDIVDEETGEVKEHKDGLLSKKMSDFLQKQLPATAKGTVGGVLAGTAFFGSPIIGGIVGATTGFISSSDKAKNALFGEIDKETGERKGGIITKKAQDMIKKAVPNMAAGAALGLLAGPFGLAGNIIFGSVMGFATSTNKFQKWLYGEEGPDGKRKGGFADKVKSELFEPITRAFRNLTSIASQQFVNLGKSLARSTKDFLFKHVGKALMKTTLGRKLMGVGKKIAGGIGGIITAPGKALDRHFRKKALKKGYTIEGLTSEERMKLRYSGELGKDPEYNINSEGYAMDQMLMGLKDNKQRQEFLDATKNLESAGRDSEAAIIAERGRVKGQLNKIYKNAKLDPKDSKALNEIYTKIASGELDPSDKDALWEEIRQATKNKLDRSDPTVKKLMESFSNISTDRTLRDKSINDAKLKIVDLIDKNDSLGKEQKDVLKKRLTEGKYNMRDIDFIQNQLGIDIKAEDERNPVERALDTIEDKLEGFQNAVTKGISETIDTLKETGKDIKYAVINTKNVKKKEWEDKKKAKNQNTIVDINKEEYEEMEEMFNSQGEDDDYDYPIFRDADGESSIPGKAKGGFVKKGLAAVSKGELILPKNFWGSFAEGTPDVDNPDVDSTGEDNNVRGQHGNVEENLGSKKVQEANKRKNSFFSAIGSIPTGFAAMNSTLTDIKNALTTGYKEGTEKKKGLLDMLKDSFFGGAVDKFKSVIANGISLAAPVLAGLLAGKLALNIAKGKYDAVGEKLGYGQASHAGDTFIDSDGDYVTQDPDSGMYVKDDGTPATGKIQAVNSETNDAMSDKFKYNFARGIVTGTGTAAGAMVKGAMKMTRSGKGVLSAASKAAKAIAGSKLVTKVGGMQIIGRGAAVKDLAKFKELKAAGKTAQEAMAVINKSSTATVVAEKLASFATKLKKVPVVGKLFSKFTPYIDDICGELAEFARKKSLGAGAKVAKSFLKTAAVVVTWAFVVADFITGTQDAEKILGIKKATTAQKFGCGLGRALLRAIPFIGTFLPEKKLIQFIFKYLPGGEKLMQAQDEMQQEVDEYNEANGTNLSVDEYQTQILGQSNSLDKAGNFIKTGIANIKQSIAKSKQSSASTEDMSAGGSYMGSYAEGGVVGSGATSFISNAVDTFHSATDMSKLPNLVNKIKEDVDKGDVKSIIKDVSKIGLGVAAGSMLPALIGPALVNAMINKITGSTNVSKTSSGAGKFGTLFTNLKKIFDLVKDGKTDAIDALNPSMEGGMFTGIFNVIKGIAKIAAVTTNPIKWLGEKLSDVLGFNKNKNKDSGDTSASGSGFVSQFDPRYRNKRLGGKSIADNGCGPATAVMAINQMNSMSGRGTSMNAAINHASKYQTMGGTDAAYFADEFARNGYKAHYSTNKGSMLQSIAAGRPTILMGRAGGGSKDYTPFGPNNHYVVANGMDSRGNIIISDPEQGGARSYSPSILKQVKLGIAGGASTAVNVMSDLDRYQMDFNNNANGNIESTLINGIEGENYGQYMTPPNAKDHPEPNMSEEEVKATGSPTKKSYNDTAISTSSLINNAYANTAIDTNSLGNPMYKNTTSIDTTTSAMMGDSRYQAAKTSGNKISSLINSSNTLNALTKAGLQDYSDESLVDKSVVESLGLSKNDSLIPSVNMTNSRYSDLISSNNTTSYDNTSEKSSKNKYEGMSILSAISSIFGDALSNIFSRGKSSTSSKSGKDKTDSSMTSGSEVSSALAALTGKDPVDYMLSLEKQVEYDYGASNPETGVSDCSAMVQWAYKKATGYDIGRSSQQQANSAYLDIVADAGGLFKYFTLDNMPVNLVRNDVLLFFRDNDHTHGGIGHVGLYIGDGQYIDHGGPRGPNGMGPRIKTLNGSRQQGLTRVCRLKQRYADELAAKGEYYNSTESQINSVNAINPIEYGKVGEKYPDTNVTRQIYKYFTQNGYTPAATAGIMGNMYRESRFDPSIVQKGSGHAAGIVQWESYKNKSARWKQMSDYAASKGKNWTDLASQLEFINQEMHGNQYIGKNAEVYKNASEYYEATNPMQAAYDFEKAYERGSVEAMDERKGAAQAYYDAYSSMDLSASGSGLKKSKLYNAMGDYIANRGVNSAPKPTSQEVHFVGSGSKPIMHKTPSLNYMASGKPISTGFAAGASVPMSTYDGGKDKMLNIVDTLCDIVQILSDHVPNVTEIYNLMKQDHDEANNLNAASGSSIKKPKLKNSSLPSRTKTNEEIAASLSELKAQVRQIVI